jgi:hypothetical protein
LRREEKEMAHKALVVVVAAIVAAAPAWASVVEPGPMTPAPAGTPETKYCLRVTVTGNISETVECWTRAEWADQDVDVDREWAKNGVRTIDG